MLHKIAFGVAMLGVMLVSGGCLLSVSSGNTEPTPISQLLPSPTPFPTETQTPGPTPEPEFFVITATPDPFELAQMTLVAQVEQATMDPDILEVTRLVQGATETEIYNQLNMTASAEFVFDIPTFTPTLDPTFELLPTFTPTFTAGNDCQHIVAAGQNLFRIGLQYNVGYQTLANYNGIANPNLISIGQSIMIPNCGRGTGSTGLDGSTGNTESGSLGGNTGGAVDPSYGSTCGSEILVDQGDTLFAISLRCNVLIRTIMSLNGISNPDLIYFNKTLRLQ